MSTEHPRFRSDLITSTIEQSGTVYYVIKDPVTRRFFRFKEPEHFIAAALDGTVSLDEVRRRFEDRFGAEMSRGKLDAFVDRLGELCLIESELTERELSRRQREGSGRGGPMGKLLYLRVKAFDPDRFFDALVPRIGFFFTRHFVLLAVLVTLVAVALVASNWDDYTAQVGEILVPRSILTFFLVVLLVTGLHELAHGLMCKHFGGHVHEMGFMLIYFLPAFYSNVSDAWLFTEKRRRLWVSFAGVFFQIFIWALAVIVWRMIDMETWLSEACCIAIATSGLTAIFNFNPLIKLDGYYLLSDTLAIPNLRREAFQYLGGRVKGLFVSPGGARGGGARRGGRGDGAPAGAMREITRREKRIFLLYGIAAAAYSFGLLLFIFVKIADFVFSQFQGSGLVVLLGIMVLVFTGSLERWTVRIHSLFSEGGIRSMSRRRKIGWWVAVAVVALVLVFGVWELKISGTFELLPRLRAHVRTEVAGTIEELYVGEGDSVGRGGLIARLDDTELEAEIGKIEAELAKRRAELELLENGPLDEEVERQQKLVERERTRVLYAEKELERITGLHEKNLVASVEYEKAQQELHILTKELEHAGSDLAVLLKGSRPETIRAARAETARLQAELDYLRWQCERTAILSPISGVITTHHLMDRRLEHVDVGEEICQIADCDTMMLEIRVSEKDVADVTVGQRVKLKVRSLPTMAFYGTVAAISPVATRNSNRTVVVVTSEVDNPEMLLLPGMTGKAKIYCGKRRIIELLTRQIVRFIRVEFWL